MDSMTKTSALDADQLERVEALRAARDVVAGSTAFTRGAPEVDALLRVARYITTGRDPEMDAGKELLLPDFNVTAVIGRNDQQVADAGRRLATLLAANADMMPATAQSLRCDEADAVADLMSEAGYTSAAALFIDNHAASDTDPDDRHYPGHKGDADTNAPDFD